jgi:preprotein translocase subunit SecE
MSQSSQSEDTRGSTVDNLWLIGALALLFAAVYGFYQFQAEYNALVRVGGLLIAVGVAALMVYQTATGKSAYGYVQGSRIELRKMVWPTRQESVQTTLLIAVVVVIVALMLWGLDSLLLWGVKALTGRG